MKHQPAADLLGGSQAPQTLEVRTVEGQLIKMATEAERESLIAAGLAVPVGRHVRLKLGIRWRPNSERPAPPPNLRELKRREPDRYGTIWSRNRKATAPNGKGMVGRAGIDQVLFRKAS